MRTELLYSHSDVEHFRPKKEAKALDANSRDGYWWLAFDYMNFRVWQCRQSQKGGLVSTQGWLAVFLLHSSLRRIRNALSARPD